MIPKILHQVWVGPNPIPEEEKEYIKTWKKYHPNWEYMIWNNDNLSILQLPPNCIEAFNASNGVYACQADIVRYVAVLKYGGVYIDTDIECYKPIDDLIKGDY